MSDTITDELPAHSSMEPKLEPTLEDRELEQTVLEPTDRFRTRNEADFIEAFKLVKKAAEAIDFLQDRCRKLDAEVQDLNARLKNEAAASERNILDWERLANAFKMQLATSEGALTDAVSNAKMLAERAAEMTSRALAAESRASAAEQLAREERELASTFRDKIFGSFGSGTTLADSPRAGTAIGERPRSPSPLIAH